MQDYYAIPAERFSQHSSIGFHFVETHEDLCLKFAREMVDRIKSNAARGKMTTAILPVGPLDYGAFAELCNQEGVSCESLVVVSMDEYCDADGRAIPPDHLLSFRAFYLRNLLDRLDVDKRFPPDQLILPDPEDLGLVQRTLEKYGGIDVLYGAFGINGHFAFNSPPREDVDLETFSNTSVRIVELREGDFRNITPYRNRLVLGKLTGALIMKILEGDAETFRNQVSGLTYRTDPKRPAGSRVLDVRVGGKSLSLSRTYTLTHNTYCTRDRNIEKYLHLKPGSVTWQRTELSDYQVLIDYARHLKVIDYSILVGKRINVIR